MLMDPKHHILRIAGRSRCARDRLMVVVLVVGGCTGEELRHLTVREALRLVHHRAKWASEEVIHYANTHLAPKMRYLPGDPKQNLLDSLLFRSKTYGGKLDRTSVSRIFRRLLVRIKLRTPQGRGVINALRALHRVFYAEWPKWVLRAALDTGFLPGVRHKGLREVAEYPPYLRWVGAAL